LSISHEVYQEIKNSVKALFLKKQDLHKKNEIDEDRTFSPT
jgi:hypothetical protein